MQELYLEVTVLARDYSRTKLPFPNALLGLTRLRALSLQIPCSVRLLLSCAKQICCLVEVPLTLQIPWSV